MVKESTYTTVSPEETQALGRKIAQKLVGGNCVLLHGDLGSGKTTLAQGIAKGLGIKKNVVSPTFLIMRRYIIDKKRTIAMLYHIDAYRLQSAQDADSLGLSEVFSDNEGVVLCEWPERINELLPEKRIDIFCEYMDDTKRKFYIQEKS